jgi:hypothetical protein
MLIHAFQGIKRRHAAMQRKKENATQNQEKEKQIETDPEIT